MGARMSASSFAAAAGAADSSSLITAKFRRSAAKCSGVQPLRPTIKAVSGAAKKGLL